MIPDDKEYMTDQFDQIEHLDKVDIFYDIKGSLEIIKEIKKLIPESQFLENYATMFSYIALYHLNDFARFTEEHIKVKNEIELAIRLKEKENG